MYTHSIVYSKRRSSLLFLFSVVGTNKQTCKQQQQQQQKWLSDRLSWTLVAVGERWGRPLCVFWIMFHWMVSIHRHIHVRDNNNKTKQKKNDWNKIESNNEQPKTIVYYKRNVEAGIVTLYTHASTHLHTDTDIDRVI